MVPQKRPVCRDRRPGGRRMFSSLGWPEIAVLLVVSMFVFGPERLPGLAADAGRALRRARAFARGVRDDLAADVPELATMNLRSLQPRTLLVRHVLGDEPAPDAGVPPRPRPTAHRHSTASASSDTSTRVPPTSPHAQVSARSQNPSDRPDPRHTPEESDG